MVHKNLVSYLLFSLLCWFSAWAGDPYGGKTTQRMISDSLAVYWDSTRVAPSNDSTIWVSSSSTYTTIAAAVAAAGDNYTIILAQGIYTDQVVNINKKLTIIGEGYYPEATKWVSDTTLFRITVDSVRIANLWLQCNSSDSMAVITNSRYSLEHCVIACSTFVAANGDSVFWRSCQIFALNQNGIKVTNGVLKLEDNVHLNNSPIHLDPAREYYGILVSDGGLIWAMNCAFNADSTVFTVDGAGAKVSLYNSIAITTGAPDTPCIKCDNGGGLDGWYSQFRNEDDNRATIIMMDDSDADNYRYCVIFNKSAASGALSYSGSASGATNMLGCQLNGNLIAGGNDVIVNTTVVRPTGSIYTYVGTDSLMFMDDNRSMKSKLFMEASGADTTYELNVDTVKTFALIVGTGAGTMLNLIACGTGTFNGTAQFSTVAVPGLLFDTTTPTDTIVVINAKPNMTPGTTNVGDIFPYIYQNAAGAFIIQRYNATGTSGLTFTWEVHQYKP